MAINNVPYANFHELNLDWIIEKVKEYVTKTDALDVSFKSLKKYVDNFIDSIDVQSAVDAKLDDMYLDGTLSTIINTYIALRATHKYIFVGDSYMKNSATERAIMTYLPGYMGLTSSDYVDATKAGTGFARSGYEYLTTLQSKVSAISDPSLITDIIIVGGWNDRNFTQTAVGTAMQTFSTYCKATFPNAKIKVAYVGWTADDDINVRMEAINGILNYQQCGLYGMEFITNSECINHFYDYFYTDGHHPSEDGAKNMAKYLASAIVNGSADVLYIENETVVIPDAANNNLGVSAITNPTIITTLHNNLTNIAIHGSYMRFTLTTAVTLPEGYSDLGKYPVHITRPFIRYASGSVSYRYNDGSWHYAQARLALLGSYADGYVRIELINDEEHENVTAVQIDRLDLNIPSIYS